MAEALAAPRPMSPEPPGPPSPPSPSGFLALRSPSPPSPAESSDPTSSPESSVHHHLQLPGEPSLVSVVTTAESIPNPSIETIPRPSSANGLVRALDPRKTPLTISRLFSGSRLKKKSRSPTPPSTNASASYLASASASASASTTAFTSASSIPSLRLSDLASESTTVEEPDSASPPSSPVSPTSTTNAGLNLFAPKPTAFRGVPLTPAGARAQAKRHSLEIVPRRPSSQASDRERERQRPLTFPASSPTTPSAPKPTVIHKSAPPSPTRPRSSADLTRRASSPTPPARPSSPLRLGRGFNIFSSMWESRNATLLPAIPSRPSSVATADEYASGAPIQHAIRNSGTFGITDDGSEIFSLIGFEHLQRRRTSSGSIIEVTQVRRSLYAENADPAEAAESVEMLAGGGEERAHAEETRSAQSSAHTFGFRSPALVTPDSERSEAERGLRLQVHPHPHDHPHGHHLHGHPHAHHLHGHPHAHQLHGHPHMHFPAEAMATENHNGHANGYPDLHTPASATLAASPTAHGASAALRAAAVMMAAHAGALVTNAGCAGDGQETLRRMAAESARFSTILEAMATSADFERDFESSGAAGHEHDTGSRLPRSRWSGQSAVTVRPNGHAEPPPLSSPPPPPLPASSPLPPPLPPLPTVIRDWAELRTAESAWSSATNELQTILGTRQEAMSSAYASPQVTETQHGLQLSPPPPPRNPMPIAAATRYVPLAAETGEVPLAATTDAVPRAVTTDDVPPLPPRPTSASSPHRLPAAPAAPRRSASTREIRLRSATVPNAAHARPGRGHGGINGDANVLSPPSYRRQQFSSLSSSSDYASEAGGARGSAGVGARVSRSISTRMRRLSRVVRSDEDEDEAKQAWFRVSWGTAGRVE